MIRPFFLILAALTLAATPALARSKRQAPAENTETAAPADAGSASNAPGTSRTRGAHGRAAKADTKSDAKGGKEKSKPVQVGSYGEWGAFTAQGKGKTCYALAQPKERAPASLKRDAAYIFISNRPSENVRNEVSIIMGFPMKDNSDAKAEIGNTTFDLICKGMNAWVKNAAREGEFIEAMKRGSKLVIKASSVKGSLNTDSYSLAGLSDALARVQKDCP